MQQETKRVHSCREKWQYTDLEEEFKIKVLLFEPQSLYSISFHPNFFIRITELGDTLGVVDMDFKGCIDEGEILNIMPVLLSDIEKNNAYPLSIIYRDTRKNDLQCSIRKVYYGKIIRSSVEE